MTAAGLGQAYRSGLFGGLSVAGAVVFATFMGFGAFARDGGLTLLEAVLMTGAMYAVPGQVVMIDQVTQGAALATAALVATFTSVRFLPIAVVLMPHFLGGCLPRLPRLLLVVAVHFVSVTSYVEAMRLLPSLKPEHRLAYFLGVISTFSIFGVTGTALGHVVAGEVPGVVALALLYLTPLYFMLSVIASAVTTLDRLAALLGGVLGPLCYLASPDLYLLFAGLAGGTLAFAIARFVSSRRG